MEKLYLYFATFVAFLSTAVALECYTCQEEEHNRGSACRSRTRQCEQFQDACTSYVRWGIPPHWTPRGDRRYYISKDCDTLQGCEKRQAATYTTCRRDYFHDWACVECCTGDLCNFYVKLGAGSVKASLFTVLSATLSMLGLRWILS